MQTIRTAYPIATFTGRSTIRHFSVCPAGTLLEAALESKSHLRNHQKTRRQQTPFISSGTACEMAIPRTTHHGEQQAGETLGSLKDFDTPAQKIYKTKSNQSSDSTRHLAREMVCHLGLHSKGGVPCGPDHPATGPQPHRQKLGQRAVCRSQGLPHSGPWGTWYLANTAPRLGKCEQVEAHLGTRNMQLHFRDIYKKQNCHSH